MTELIKINNQSGKQVVSALELYEVLGLGVGHFSKWAAKNIINNDFSMESVDYQILRTQGEKGRPTVDYALTIEFAKKLSMLARTEQGEKVRNYFIACEQKLLAPKTEAEKVLEAINILQHQVEDGKQKLELANRTIQIQAPKVQYVNEVLQSKSSHTTTSIAKELGMAAPTLNKKLKEMGIQYNQDGHWVLYAKYQDKGYAKTRTYTYYDSEGNPKTSLLTVWTESGREFIHRALNRNIN